MHHGLTDIEVAVLNPTSTVLWVGAVMLESQGHSTEGIHIPEFLREWQNLLPEVWRGFANLEIIKVHVYNDRCLAQRFDI